MLRRLRALLPWNVLRTYQEARRLPELRDKVVLVRHQVATLRKQAATQAKRLDALHKQVETLSSQLLAERKEVARVKALSKQSQAVARGEAEPADSGRARNRVINDRTLAQAQAVVAAAHMETDPCPHVVLEELLPRGAYDTLVAAIPAPLFFEHLPVNRQDLKIPLQFAPRRQRESWLAFHELVTVGLIPALSAKFQTALDGLVRTHWPAFDSMSDAGIRLHPVAARIMRRRPGYTIKPHRDPRWAFLTCILYLTKSDDRQLYGTQLGRLRHERDAPSHSPFWVDEDEVEIVREVPGRPNTAVVFLNSTGVHSASIPDDAPPETDRYIWQLQLGPERAVRDALIGRLPAEHVERWTMKNADTAFKY